MKIRIAIGMCAFFGDSVLIIADEALLFVFVFIVLALRNDWIFGECIVKMTDLWIPACTENVCPLSIIALFAWIFVVIVVVIGTEAAICIERVFEFCILRLLKDAHITAPDFVIVFVNINSVTFEMDSYAAFYAFDDSVVL